MSSTAAWSSDRVLLLHKLWVDGLSASQIAKALGGVSRSAVIGKVHRLGLAGRASPSPPGKAARARSPAGRPARPARRLPPGATLVRTAPPPPDEGPGLAAGVLDLSAHVCRWPIGDPKAAGFSFCGRPAVGVYCQAHRQAGVQPGERAALERDPIVRRALAGRA